MASALLWVGFFVTLGQGGLNLFILRLQSDDILVQVREVRLLLYRSACGFVALQTITLLVLFTSQRVELESKLVATFALGLSCTTQICSTWRRGLLERARDFQGVAAVELTSAFANLVVIVVVSSVGLSGLAGLSIANATQACVLSFGYRLLSSSARLNFELASRTTTPIKTDWRREAVSHWFHFQVANSMWASRNLILPVVVLPTCGPVPVANINLSLRLVDNLGLLRQAIVRIAPSYLGEALQKGRTFAVMEQFVQSLLVCNGPLLFLCSLLLLKFWSRDAFSTVLPWLVLSNLASLPFVLHTPLLMLLGMYSSVTAFSVASSCLMWGTAIALVARFGALAYPVAELVSCLAFFIQVWLVRGRYLPSISTIGMWLGILVFQISVMSAHLYMGLPGRRSEKATVKLVSGANLKTSVTQSR